MDGEEGETEDERMDSLIGPGGQWDEHSGGVQTLGRTSQKSSPGSVEHALALEIQHQQQQQMHQLSSSPNLTSFGRGGSSRQSSSSSRNPPTPVMGGNRGYEQQQRRAQQQQLLQQQAEAHQQFFEAAAAGVLGQHGQQQLLSQGANQPGQASFQNHKAKKVKASSPPALMGMSVANSKKAVQVSFRQMLDMSNSFLHNC